MKSDTLDLSKVIFSDPRKGQAYELRLSKTEKISNEEKRIVMVLCSSYGVYTNAAQMSQLIETAASCYPASPLFISVPKTPRSEKYQSLLPPSWLCAWDSIERQCFRLDQPERLDIETIFEEWGDWGIWTFASPKDVAVLEQSSDAFASLDVGYAARQADKWNYAITIDLDGGLVGFLQASPKFDLFHGKLAKMQEG